MAAYVEITIEQGANLNSTVSVNDTQGDALNLYYYRLNNSEDISKLVALYNDVDNNFDIDEDVQEKLLDSIYDKYVSLGGDTSED